MEQNNFNKLDDFRDLRYFFEIVGDLNASLVTASLDKDINQVVSYLREYIVECSSYMKTPSESIVILEQKYEELLKFGLNKKNSELTNIQITKKNELLDKFMLYQRQLRIEINTNLAQSGLRPRAKKITEEKVEDRFKGVIG